MAHFDPRDSLGAQPWWRQALYVLMISIPPAVCRAWRGYATGAALTWPALLAFALSR